jgi:phenylpropionate dioxygenase-like ring-hydroxylating dioxygenase large terminal subunit
LSDDVIDDPVLLNDWHVVARASEVAIGEVRAVCLLGRELVLWRNGEGFHAWLDLCIHRGARLSRGKVERECIVCPYHGWNYNSKGDCVRIPAHPQLVPPARAHATTFEVRERYDLVWVCLGTPDTDIAPFPEWDDASFRKAPAGPYDLKANGPRVLENFLDVGHFAYVHTGLLGDPDRPEIEDYDVETTAEGIIARDIPVWQPDPDGTGEPAVVKYTYRVHRTLTASFFKEKNGNRFSMFFTVTPVDEGASRAWGVLAINYAPEMTVESMTEFQNTISLQDIPVVESQRPELLPLDLQAELHLRSDRTAIAYRQWLKKIGIRHGIA